jgi:hypothetical protein
MEYDESALTTVQKLRKMEVEIGIYFQTYFLAVLLFFVYISIFFYCPEYPKYSNLNFIYKG